MKMYHSMLFPLLMLLFAVTSCKEKQEPTPDPEPEVQATSFTASLDASAGTPFKTFWAEGDAIQLIGVKDGKSTTETVKASSLSSASATFTSNGSIKADCDEYYAFIAETGVTGCDPASSWTVSSSTSSTRSIAVAKCGKGGKILSFKNMFSFLKVNVSDASVKSIELQGNNEEDLNYDVTVSTSDYSVSIASKPSFEAQKSIKVNVSGTGDCYISLVPGTVLEQGYTITACDASGKVVSEAVYPDQFIVPNGKVITAAKFAITKTKDFDAADIVLSLGVVSDVHINQQAQANKWKAALQQLKAKALEDDPNGMAGILVVGDLIDKPDNSQLSLFKSTLESEIDVTKTPMIYTIGNHDVPNYAWASSMVSDVAYIRDMFGDSYFLADRDQDMRTKYEARHCVIGGYHILTISPNGDSPVAYDPTAVSWLDSQLAAITSAEPEKYVIVLTHPMIKNTVYGSRLGEEGGIWESTLPHYWATDALTPALKKYPQAVVFGGHLHFPLNDPRSVWQGEFSVFGCASVRYMALENGKYEDMSGATVMKDCNDFSQGNLLQFDASGNMRVLRMDFWNKDVIGGPIVSSYPTSGKGHLTKYNHTTLSLANAAPSLSTLSVDVADGVATVKWAAGTDDEFVHHYVLTLKKGGAVVTTKKILADFYKSAKTTGMKKEWTRSLGSLADGTYELTLEAYDSWDAAAKPLTKTFVVGATSNGLWANDDAGSKAVSGGSGNVSQDWLTYSDGTLSWSANSTGKPRTATITLPNGEAYSVTQISVEDFKGSWTLYSKLFDHNNTLGKGNISADKTVVTFGEPRKKETLKDASGKEHINNIGIVGLYFMSTLDACVEIDYEARTVSFGIFFDRRAAQPAAEGKYCAYLPECSEGYWSVYNFAPGDKAFSDTNYEWLWFNVSGDQRTMKYQYYGAGQKTSNGKYYICGISIPKATSTDKSSIADSYDVIYQANYNGSNTESMYFTRD